MAKFKFKFKAKFNNKKNFKNNKFIANILSQGHSQY